MNSNYTMLENFMRFSCSASGFLDIGTYAGFYFSKADIPYAFEFSGVKLVEVEPNVYEAEDEKGSRKEHNGHKFHTEKIRDNWYYIQHWY